MDRGTAGENRWEKGKKSRDPVTNERRALQPHENRKKFAGDKIDLFCLQLPLGFCNHWPLSGLAGRLSLRLHHTFPVWPRPSHLALGRLLSCRCRSCRGSSSPPRRTSTVSERLRALGASPSSVGAILSHFSLGGECTLTIRSSPSARWRHDGAGDPHHQTRWCQHCFCHGKGSLRRSGPMNCYSEGLFLR